MPDEIAFLRTILEHPDEDGPRLVYADWLEENGETPRAEFIRVQIEMAHLPGNDARRATLVEREQVLMARFGRRWLKRVGGFIRDAEFHRGIIDFARVMGSDFVRHGRRLFERAAVTRVRLTNAGQHLAAIASSPALRWLRSLDIGYNALTVGQLSELVHSPLLAGMRALDVSANNLGSAGVTTIAESPHLGELVTLNLARNNIPASSLDGLRAETLPKLCRLGLDGSLVGGVAALVRSALVDRLRVLSMHSTRLVDADAEAIADCGRLVQLTELNLSANSIGDEGAIALADAPSLAALEVLDLSYNQIGPRGARAIALSRHFDDMRRLTLTANRVGRSAAILRRRFGDRVHGLPTDT